MVGIHHIRKWRKEEDIKGGLNITYLPQFDDKEKIDNLEPGIYCVEITDDKCCSAEQCFNIYACQDWNDLSPSKINVTNETASGMKDGRIVLDMPLTPVNSFYSFVWYKFPDLTTPILNISEPELKNISTGEYSVEIVDLNCPVNKTTRLITVGLDKCTALALTSIVKNDCSGLGGSIDIYPSGYLNLANLKYEWADIDYQAVYRKDLKPGDYSVTVTDKVTKCIVKESFTIKAGDKLSVLGNNMKCLDTSIPSVPNIVNNSTGACLGCKYHWDSPSGNGLILNGYPYYPGIYTVTVTSPYGCTLSKDYEFVDLTPEYIKPCISANGSKVSGNYNFKSSSIYAIKWDDGSISNSHVVGVGQTFNYTITGSQGCTISNTVTLPVLNGDDVIVDYNACKPDILKVTPLGMNFPVKLDFNKETKTNPSNGQITTFNLIGVSGLQKLQFTDVKRGCTATKDIDLTRFFPIVIQNVTESCVVPTTTKLKAIFPQPSNIIDDDIIGYKWSNGKKNQIIDANIGETYSLTITAKNGCTSSASYFNSPSNYPTKDYDPFKLSRVIDDCSAKKGKGTGQVFIQPNLNFVYNWDNGRKGTLNDTLKGGVYTVTATGVNGVCGPFVKQYVVRDLSTLKPKSFSECLHQGDGSLVFEYKGNNTQIIWEDGSSSIAKYNLSAGSYCYKVIISDAPGCSISDCALVESNFKGDYIDPCGAVYCGGELVSHELDNDISIDIDMCYFDQVNGQVEGGIRIRSLAKKYISFRLIGQNGTDEQGDLSKEYYKSLETGKYLLTYYDEEYPNCTRDYEFEVMCCQNAVSDKLITSQNVTAATNGNNGSIRITTVLPINSANMHWSGPNNFSGIGLGINNLEPGQYCLSIKYLCNSERVCFTVGGVSSCSTSFNSIVVTTTSSCDCHCVDKKNQGSITLTGLNPATTSFSWAEGLGYGYNGVFENLPSGIYTLFLSNNPGCKKTLDITVSKSDSKLISRNGCELQFECEGKTTTKVLAETIEATDNLYTCDYYKVCSDGERFFVKESDPNWEYRCAESVCFATAKCAKFNLGVYGKFESKDVFGLDGKKCGRVENCVFPEKSKLGTHKCGQDYEGTCYLDYAKWDSINQVFINTCGLFYVNDKGGIEDFNADGKITIFGDSFLKQKTCNFTGYPCSFPCDNSLFLGAKIQAPIVYSTHIVTKKNREDNEISVSVTPNPFREVLNLSLYSKSASRVKISLYDALGKLYIQQYNRVHNKFPPVKRLF
jgi:hypothetical protein